MTSHPALFLVAGRSAPGDLVHLEGGEARHARVRRIGLGEQVVVIDGAGWSALAVVESASRRGFAARIVDELPARHGESPLELTLALAFLKTDRFEWAIEKVVELGVTAIVPFASAHSLARPSASRLERWREIAKSAVKQCGRSSFPRIGEPLTFDDVLRAPGPRILFCERTPHCRIEEARDRIGKVERLTVIVGPEGGFTTEEVEKGRAAGSIVAGLGPRILRADTAAVSAATLCQLFWGDLGAA